MTDTLRADSAARFSEALVLEIKAEMGRQDLSSRALGRLIGHSSQYVSMRLDGGNPKTGQRVNIAVTDLVMFGRAMDVDPNEWISAAKAAAGID